MNKQSYKVQAETSLKMDRELSEVVHQTTESKHLEIYQEFQMTSFLREGVKLGVLGLVNQNTWRVHKSFQKLSSLGRHKNKVASLCRLGVMIVRNNRSDGNFKNRESSYKFQASQFIRMARELLYTWRVRRKFWRHGEQLLWRGKRNQEDNRLYVFRLVVIQI